MPCCRMRPTKACSKQASRGACSDRRSARRASARHRRDRAAGSGNPLGGGWQDGRGSIVLAQRRQDVAAQIGIPGGDRRFRQCIEARTGRTWLPAGQGRHDRAIATAYFAVADIQSVRRHLDQAVREAATTGTRCWSRKSRHSSATSSTSSVGVSPTPGRRASRRLRSRSSATMSNWPTVRASSSASHAGRPATSGKALRC